MTIYNSIPASPILYMKTNTKYEVKKSSYSIVYVYEYAGKKQITVHTAALDYEAKE